MNRTYLYSGHYYNVEKLWKLTKNLPIEMINVSSMSNQTHSQIWIDNFNNRFSILDVLNNSTKYSDHIQKIKNSDLDYAILVNIDYSIIDGFHRLGKTIMKKISTINAKVVSPQMLEEALIKNTEKHPCKFLYIINPIKNIENYNNLLISSSIGYSNLGIGLLKYLKYTIKKNISVLVKRNPKTNLFNIMVESKNIKELDISIAILHVTNKNFIYNSNLIPYAEFQGTNKHKIISAKIINVLKYLVNCSYITIKKN